MSLWPRPYWKPGGADAFVQWFVFGDFTPELRIDAERFRTRGTPVGIEVVRCAHAALESWDGYPLGGTMGRLFEREDAALFERARASRECLILRGNIADADDLDDLRDLVGTIAALIDLGGVAVVDPQMLSMFDAAEWHRRYFASESFASRDHVAILASEDETAPGRCWIHTRGLRKFGRPDIGLRNVPPAYVAHAGQLAERFADFQALGGLVEEGREIIVEGLPSNMTAHHAGSVHDPEFNNVHLAIRWPD